MKSALHGQSLAPSIELGCLVGLMLIGKVRRDSLEQRPDLGVLFQVRAHIVDEPSPVPLFALSGHGKRDCGYPQMTNRHGERHA